MVEQSDIQLLKDIIAERPGAVDRLVDRHSRLIYKIVFNVLKTSTETQEATQDVLLKVIKSAHKYDTNFGSLNTWIGRIAYRTAIDYYRKRKSTDDIDSSRQIATDRGADHAITQTEKTAKIEQMLSKLSPDNEQLVRLFYLEEYSVKELSKVLNLSESNIKTKLFRIRKELFKVANQLFDQEDLNL